MDIKDWHLLRYNLDDWNLVSDYKIQGVGTTGSGRNLAGALVGADVVKNEITAHAVAASTYIPGVQTILEIGGQDSKIIILRDGIVTDFAMNTVCAAGTGSFLDQQASRLNVPIENFGDVALRSTSPARIAGRCGVFAESDLIHKQQLVPIKQNGYRQKAQNQKQPSHNWSQTKEYTRYVLSDSRSEVSPEILLLCHH